MYLLDFNGILDSCGTVTMKVTLKSPFLSAFPVVRCADSLWLLALMTWLLFSASSSHRTSREHDSCMPSSSSAPSLEVHCPNRSLQLHN